MSDLYELLGDDEADRRRYPTLDAFMPRIVAYCDGPADRIGGMRTRGGARGRTPAAKGGM